MLNLSFTKDHPLFLKSQVGQNFLPLSSNFVFKFSLSTLYATGTNFRILEKNEILEPEGFFLKDVLHFF